MKPHFIKNLEVVPKKTEIAYRRCCTISTSVGRIQTHSSLSIMLLFFLLSCHIKEASMCQQKQKPVIRKPGAGHTLATLAQRNKQGSVWYFLDIIWICNCIQYSNYYLKTNFNFRKIWNTSCILLNTH